MLLFQILSVAGEEVFSLRYVQYIRSEKEKMKMGLNDFDMEVVLSFAEMRFVFLNIWLQQMLVNTTLHFNNDLEL